MNKNGEEKALTIRYKIYLDKIANYNNYDKKIEEVVERFESKRKEEKEKQEKVKDEVEI